MNADQHSAAEPQPKKTPNTEEREEAEDWKETGGTPLEMQNKRKRKTQPRGKARGAAREGKESPVSNSSQLGTHLVVSSALQMGR
jgi:hypothetical protein